MLWSPDPVLFSLGDVQVRAYGILFAAGLALGHFLWSWQMKRARYPAAAAEGFLLWGGIAIIIGARLGQALFYEPAAYLSDPSRLLRIQEGGLASHGATVGLFLAVLFVSRRHRLPFIDLADRLAIALPAGIVCVRVGNFLNSEIVGIESRAPWAIRFANFDAWNQSQYERIHGPVGYAVESLPRHPSQLYEALLGVLIFGALFAADRLGGREKRPRGLLMGLFLVLYFGGRIALERFKEHQTRYELVLDPALRAIHVVSDAAKEGQWLSVLPALLGVAVLIRVARSRRSA